MNRKYFSTMIFGAALLSLTACTQDELADGTDTLPEGVYPLEIASVAISGESSVQPWGANAPQTRVGEETDGNSSKWEIGDEFYVKFAGTDQVGTYRITDAGAGTVEALTLVYWQSASKQQTIIAWHAPDADTDGKLDLSDQSKGLIYVTRAEETATYNTTSGAVSLGFKHQLAKVRVQFTGANASKVEDVKIEGYTSCTVKEGTVSTEGAQTGDITTRQTTLSGGTVCWEANMVPGEIKTIKVNGVPATIRPVTSTAGKLSTITIEVKEPIEIIPSDEAKTLNLTGGDVVNITGNGTAVSGNYTINIAQGNTATVNLSNVNLKASTENKSSPAFNIDGGGTVIFNLCGTENTIEGFRIGIRGDWGSQKTAADIHIIGPGTLSVKGSGTQEINGCIVTDHGKDIKIENATLVLQYTNPSALTTNAIIGSGGSETCGNITIYKSDIKINAELAYELNSSGYTTDNWYGAAIGAGRNGICGNIAITLKEGQTKTAFLDNISVKQTTYNLTLSDEQKVGKGIYSQSCG